jgi:hypothetical protein
MYNEIHNFFYFRDIRLYKFVFECIRYFDLSKFKDFIFDICFVCIFLCFHEVKRKTKNDKCFFNSLNIIVRKYLAKYFNAKCLKWSCIF